MPHAIFPSVPPPDVTDPTPHQGTDTASAVRVPKFPDLARAIRTDLDRAVALGQALPLLPLVRLAADRLGDAATLAGHAEEVSAAGGHAPDYQARARQLASAGRDLLGAAIAAADVPEFAWNPTPGIRVQVGQRLLDVATVTRGALWVDHGLVGSPASTRQRLSRQAWCALARDGRLVCRAAA